MGHTDDCSSCRVVDEIKAVLASDRPPFEKVRAVEIALHRPHMQSQPVKLTERRWPVLSGNWETLDQPELNR